MIVRVKRFVVALGLTGALAATAACSGSLPSIGSSPTGAAKSVRPSSRHLPLAMPNAVGPQPTQVDPNKVYPCTVTEQSTALDMVPAPKGQAYTLQFARGGWCFFGPKNHARNAPMFSILYEGRKGKSQIGVNYGDALAYSREHFERKFGSADLWKIEKIPPVNTNQDYTVLVGINKPGQARRYTDVIVTTRSAPNMTLLLHFEDHLLNRAEAEILARNAASAAYRAGLKLR